MKLFKILIFVIMAIDYGFCIIGYDCGTRTANMTTISLLDIDDCEVGDDHISKGIVKVFLFQANEYDFTEAIQCKVEITRTVHYCGWFSHMSVVKDAYMEYVHPMTYESCQKAIDHGTMRISNTIIDGLIPNTTTPRPITLAGKSNNAGDCKGASYSDPYDNWDNVVVMGTVRVTLKTMSVRTKLHNNKVYLPSGYKCSLNEGHCIDPEGGHTFWSPLPTSLQCPDFTYSLLYNGPAIKMSTKDTTIYSVNVDKTSFSLSTSGGVIHSCGLALQRTEHPKLFLAEALNLEELRANSAIKLKEDNMDMFLYVNSKFVFVERFIRKQIESLYREVVLHRCNLEKKMLRNSLAIATQSPDEFAYKFMKGPGYMAVVAGEVIHMVQCVPVEVKIKHLHDCYDRLPVLRGNESYFLTPKTHVLTTHATQIPCNSPLLQYYKLGVTWYKITPKPVETVTPASLKPDSKISWKYNNPTHLATGGIYTEDDLEAMRNRIMFAMEQNAILENMAYQITNKSHQNQPSVFHLFDEDSMERLAESAWQKTWGKFLKFGTISAGFIGIFMIFQLIKVIIDTVVHGYTLHTIYGWSLQMLGALWNSITYLLIHLARDRDIDRRSRRTAGMRLRDLEDAEFGTPLNSEPCKPELREKDPAYPEKSLQNSSLPSTFLK